MRIIPVRPGVEKEPPVRQPVIRVEKDELKDRREGRRRPIFYQPGI